MNLGLYPIASSSKGNCYLIRSEKTAILLDAGVAGTKIDDELKKFELSLFKNNALLLTHEHIDHVKSAYKVLAKGRDCNLYCSNGTREAIAERIKNIDDEKINVVETNQTFMVGDVEVTAFGISHDANEPLSYTFKKNGKKISIVTDTGKMTQEMDAAIANSDILVIESNHEVNILLYGRYPYHVKRRILSDVGHLSNEACGEAIARFLDNQTEEKTPYVYLAHLSQENNTPQQAMLTVKNVLEEKDYYVGKHLRIEVLSPEDDNDYVVI